MPQPPHPTITPKPSALKRKRRRTLSHEHDDFDVTLLRRQDLADQSAVNAAKAECANTGNDVVSCFPTSGVTIPQHELVEFVWNSRRPQLTQTNKVNVYMLRVGDSTPLLQWIDIDNPTTGLAGSVAAQVNDTWFPNEGLNWSGSNQTSPYYWVITRADQDLDGSQTPQATFTAVQTTIADSVSSSIASVSAASTASLASVTNSASRSVASVSSVSAQSTASVASVSSVSAASTSAAGPSGTATSGASGGGPNGSTQNDAGSNFPHWAIAVIVVLGFLAIVAICILIFLILRRIRNRRNFGSNARNSMGSSSPMIPAIIGASGRNGEPQSPQMEERGGAGLYDPAAAASVHSPQHDDASLASHSHSGAHSVGDPGLFSGADAAIMADAFRKVLRKPDFAGSPIEEGESPDSQEPPASAGAAPGTNQLMNWELAEEGRDIRSVGSSRGVRVETQSDTDGASTAH